MQLVVVISSLIGQSLILLQIQEWSLSDVPHWFVLDFGMPNVLVCRRSHLGFIRMVVAEDALLGKSEGRMDCKHQESPEIYTPVWLPTANPRRGSRLNLRTASTPLNIKVYHQKKKKKICQSSE